MGGTLSLLASNRFAFNGMQRSSTISVTPLGALPYVLMSWILGRA